MALICESELLRLQLSVRDFEDSRDFIDAAKKHDVSSPEYSALVMAAIICYARPFTNNERTDKKGDKDQPEVAPTLRLEEPSSVLGQDVRLHEDIKRMRNKAVAHSEWSHNQVRIVPTCTAGIAFAGRKWHIVDEDVDLAAFRRIAEAMRQYCINKLVEVTQTQDDATCHSHK